MAREEERGGGQGKCKGQAHPSSAGWNAQGAEKGAEHIRQEANESI
jgi:hypothetical protein